MDRALDTLSADLFAPLVGSAFTLHADALTLGVSLAGCARHPRATMRGSSRTAFSLDLCGPDADVPPFTGGDFLLSHPRLGAIGPLRVERILPVGYGPGTAVFQIVFN